MSVGGFRAAKGSESFSRRPALTASMPLRDYVCEACGHRQEELIRRTEDELDLSCAECGSRDLTRQLSAPSLAGGGGGGGGYGCDTGG